MVYPDMKTASLRLLMFVSLLMTAFSASAQLGLNQWDDGYFYDANGTKICRPDCG